MRLEKSCFAVRIGTAHIRATAICCLVALVACKGSAFRSPSGTGSSDGGQGTMLVSRQECLGVPECVSVEQTLVGVTQMEKTITLACPQAARFLWNWDADRTRDVGVSLVKQTQESGEFTITDGNPEIASSFKIYLGCSPVEPSRRTFNFTNASSGGWDVEGGLTAGDGASLGRKGLRANSHSSPCRDIQDCMEVSSPTIILRPLETKAIDIYCPANAVKNQGPSAPLAPYYRGYSEDKDHGNVVVYAWSVPPTDHGHFTVTNWDTRTIHGVVVTAACSANPPPDACIVNLKCPTIEGTMHSSCTTGRGSMFCRTWWEERCSNGKHYYCEVGTLEPVPCCYYRP